MKAYIRDISYYLPDKIVTNNDIVNDFPEWSVEKIADKVGVNTRHIAEQETATDMAIKAAEKLFIDSSVLKDEIDFLLLCTQSPDYFLPSSSCIIQNELGLRTNIGAFDYNLGCSGYIYGLAMAKGLILGGIAKNVLLLTAETYNKYIHSRDKGNRTIFGDAASATVIGVEGFAEIGEFSLGTDGKGANNLIVKSGGSRHKEPYGDLTFDDNGNPICSDNLFMNGSKIFVFTQKNVPSNIKDTIIRNNLEMDDIQLFILHQANKYMLEFLRSKMKINENKFFINLSEVGNTVSNSIPIALVNAKQQKKLNGNILLCGFGVGYSWGGTILTII